MPEIGALVAGGALLGGAGWWARRHRVHARVRARLGAADRTDAAAGDDTARAAGQRPPQPIFAARRTPALLLGVATALAGLGIGDLRFGFASAAGAGIAVLGILLTELRAIRTAARLEAQLGDAIDLCVGSLLAGAGPVLALESASRRVAAPLAPLLIDTVSRLRLGEPATDVFARFSSRAPLESCELFAFVLAVHWQSGASLAPALTTVGRAVRDRAELSARARTQSASTLASVAALGLATASVAYLSWSHDPGNLRRFLASEGGGSIVAASLWLQAAGVLWIWRASQEPLR